MVVADFGQRTNRQAIRVWPHSEIFTGRRPVKMLVGEIPKPAELLDTLSGSPGASAHCWWPGANAPGPYFFARPRGRAGDRYQSKQCIRLISDLPSVYLLLYDRPGFLLLLFIAMESPHFGHFKKYFPVFICGFHSSYI